MAFKRCLTEYMTEKEEKEMQKNTCKKLGISIKQEEILTNIQNAIRYDNWLDILYMQIDILEQAKQADKAWFDENCELDGVEEDKKLVELIKKFYYKNGKEKPNGR